MNDYLNRQYRVRWYDLDSNGEAISNFLISNYFNSQNTDQQYDWGIVLGINNLFSDDNDETYLAKRTYGGNNWWDMAVTSIHNDIPCMLNLQNDPTYGSHWVVITGFKILSGSPLEYDFLINDGYGHNDAWVTTDYGYSIVYFADDY